MSADETSRLDLLEQENRELRNALKAKDDFIQQVLGSYVTTEVAQEILAKQGSPVIEGERRRVAMLFSDLRGSTELAERMDAADYLRLLNHYLEDMIFIIDGWQGNILEFVGDAIVAVFGAPRHSDDAAKHALYSAVAMQRRMGAINEWNAEQGFPYITMGIGVHVGEAIVGTIGSETRMKYDMIGQNVNLAARIESATRGGQILASSEAIEAAGAGVVERDGGSRWIEPKGFSKRILIHDVVGFGNLRI